MAIEMSTAGIQLGWAMETVAGVMPMGDDVYTRIRGITTIGALDAAPATIEVTDLNDTRFARFIDDLISIDGAIELDHNMTDEFLEDWMDGIMPAYEQGIVDGLQMWFTVFIPRLQYGNFYFRGNPSVLGLPAIAIREAFTGTAAITPTLIHSWDAKHTIAEP